MAAHPDQFSDSDRPDSDEEIDNRSVSLNLVSFIMNEYTQGLYDKTWILFFFKHEGFRETVLWQMSDASTESLSS